MKRFLTLALTCLPFVCFGATTYTTYFNNTHTYTNSTTAGTNSANRGVFTNGITAGASTFTGAVDIGFSNFIRGGDADSGVTFGADGRTMDWLRDGAVIARIGTSAGFASSIGLGTTGASTDTILVRDGAANTLAMRNGVNAQTFNVYNTYTDASNYERATLSWNGTLFTLGSSFAGTGTRRDIKFTGQNLYFTAAGTDRWQISSSGHLLASTDNSWDIGASGATRPRNIYAAGGGVFSGSIQTFSVLSFGTSAHVSAPGDGIVLMRNNALNDFNRLQFGGTTASFPALKRSSTELQVRLADDSADAPLKSGQLSNTGIRVMTPSSLQTLAAANALLANATKVRVVGSGGAVTLTSTPTITDGSDGQYVMIQGTDDTNTLTVQDQGSLASSNLELGAATRVLGAGDVLVLTFDSTASVWYEVSFANN